MDLNELEKTALSKGRAETPITKESNLVVVAENGVFRYFIAASSLVFEISKKETELFDG